MTQAHPTLRTTPSDQVRPLRSLRRRGGASAVLDRGPDGPLSAAQFWSSSCAA